MTMSNFGEFTDHPLSINQQSMWLIHNCSKDKNIYNSHFAWKLPDSVDINILKKSLQLLVDRHPILRTLFVPTNEGEITQRVYKQATLNFTEQKIAEMSDDAFSSSIVDKEFKQPFDLEKETAMRWLLCTLPNNQKNLILVFHHIVVDMGSFMIFANELRDIYQALKANQPMPLEAINQTFSDFVTAQNDFVHTQAGVEQESFWLTELKDIEASLDIPVDKKRPVDINTTSGYLNTFIPYSVTEKFNAFASENKLSLFGLYIAAYHLLLFKYTNQSDILVGTPTDGKGGDFTGVFGYFTNPVISRSTIDPALSIKDFFVQMNDKTKNAISNQRYPLARLSEKLKLVRETNKASLFQTSFAWQNINAFENRGKPFVTWDHAGKRLWDFGEAGIWERFNRRQQLDDLDLTFKIYKFKNDFHLGIEYNSDLFHHNSIEQMAEHYQQLMLAISDNPDQSISQLSMLTSQEETLVTKQWNQTHVDYDKNKLLHHYVDEWATSNGQLIALRNVNEEISYATLTKRSNQLAHYLVKKGVKAETIVGIAMDRTPDTIISILAIHKAGGAYLPLDPQYPKDRIEYMIDDANIATIITHKSIANTLPVDPLSCIYLDEQWDDIEQFPEHTPDVARSPSDLAYVIYTSGSTGKPKGVLVEQAQLCNHLVTLREAFSITADDHVLQFHTLNFDASVMIMCLALQSGASLFLTPKETLIGESLSDIIRNQKISAVMLPPSVLALLKPEHFPSVKYLMVGGEAVSIDLAKKWAKQGHKLINAYGPTEATIWVTTALLDGSVLPPIGKALANTQLYILDSHLKPQPVGIQGELHIAGDCLTRGYLNRPEQTEQAFIANPFSKDPTARMYKSGDMARFLPDGTIECLGRFDHQLKIRGFRIELGEIESSILKHPSVDDVLVMARDDMGGKSEGGKFSGDKLLAAYIISNDSSLSSAVIRDLLKKHLPDYMVPSGFVFLDAFPLTPNEKVDRKALPIPELGSGKNNQKQLPHNEIEKVIAGIWQDVLNLNDVSTNENFFDIGGHSLLLGQVYGKLPDNIKHKLSMVDLFKYPTIKALSQYLKQDDDEEDKFYLQHDEHIERMRLRRRTLKSIGGLKIAIVGMSGRFPGAENVNEFWQNILSKEESVRFYSDDELIKGGVDKNLVNDPAYVGAKGAISNPKGFDATFFGFSPREAQVTDPQQRLFLECTYEALEDAACVPDTFKGLIGVYAGTGINNYLMNHISAHPDLVNVMGDFPILIGNDKDFLSNRVSYKLNLNGPAMVIQTACSTSLVAIHTACQALISEECDAALAGGVSLGKLDDEGYLYKEGMIMSPDGHCRAFDENAKGTVQAQGAGVVLLKRLDDAMRDNDHVYAVIKGSGINNDGSAKSGYTAPSIEGQATAIMLAHASADVSPNQVTYIEAHGTGTPLGDPIEIEGLNYAFTQRHIPAAGVEDSTDKAHTCALGSVKSNIGHMDAASGVVGLIKSAKALEQKILPPSLHFATANPKINFANSPFYVNTEARPWPEQDGLRHAGVSSFGIGGTNAHTVLSEAPSKTDAGRSRPWRIITLSAKTETALETMTVRLHAYLSTYPKVRFSDICYTLHVGRKLFDHRRYLVCKNVDDALLELSKLLPDSAENNPASHISNSTSHPIAHRIVTQQNDNIPRKIAFMFSGQGSQYVSMARKLYKTELNFRAEVDRCRGILRERFVFLFEQLEEDDFSALTDKVHDTYITQPALFIAEYALARMLMSWNIQPSIMIGHSIGEYVAACLAGVFTLEQALELVTLRGRMIYDLEKGDMLMVELSEQDAQGYLNESLSLAAINGEQRCVISGQSEAIIALQKTLNQKSVQNRILHTSHAFHSHMMDDILEDFTRSVVRRNPQKPQMPFVSSLTGNMITDNEATSPDYWAKHLRQAVRFHQGLDTLFNLRENADSGWILMEIGPGKTLATLARQHAAKTSKDVVYETMRHSYEDISDTKKLLITISRLWMNNVAIDWEVFHADRQRYKTPLPTYPFERLDYWVESGKKMRLTHDRRNMGEKTLPPLPRENLPEQTKETTVVAARDPVDAFICQLWATSLGVAQVGIHDNYFDLGGDSLQAVNIIDKLVTQYQTPIATHILIQKPTIAELADYIKSVDQHPEVLGADNLQVRNTPLVTIQQGSKHRQPLFMVHPIGGEVYFYRDLAHQLGADQPFYAFQAQSLSGQSEPYEDVKVMATDYVAELKAIGAKPPYLLGGSSFGGLVAYEMAQQLKVKGEEVRLLVMIDTPFPKEMPAHLTNSAAILHYLLDDKIPLDMGRLNQLDPTAQIDYVLEEARIHDKSDVIPPHLGVPLFTTWIAHQKATFAYKPEPYTDDVIFFRHTERMEHFPAEPHKTWQEFYFEGKIETRRVPGDHITMNYNPNVKKLAGFLSAALQGAVKLPRASGIMLEETTPQGKRSTNAL